MSDDDLKMVATKLSPEMQAELDGVRNYHGLENNSETLRFLIRKEARSIRESAPLFAATPQEAQ